MQSRHGTFAQATVDNQLIGFLLGVCKHNGAPCATIATQNLGLKAQSKQSQLIKKMIWKARLFE